MRATCAAWMKTAARVSVWPAVKSHRLKSVASLLLVSSLLLVVISSRPKCCVMGQSTAECSLTGGTKEIFWRVYVSKLYCERFCACTFQQKPVRRNS